MIDSLASMSAALACACTMHVSDADVVVRVYLVPQDLPMLYDLAYSRGKTKRPAGATVLNVLQAVRVSEEEWMGVPQDGDVPSLMEEADRRSLLEVYRDIESPAHDESFLGQVDAPDNVKSRLAWSLTENPSGITTTLFPYQRATLAKMLTRELAPQDVPHPAFIARSTSLGTGRDFWVSVDGSVRHKPTVVREPQGGILAEDMGVGKTLIILSLVMSTLSELPSVDGFSSYLDSSQPSPSPVLLTALSRDFPFKAEM